MSVINFLYERTVLPLFEHESHQGLARRLNDLRRRETHSIATNQEMQWAALQRLLQHAYETVPFYRQRFEQAGLNRQGIRTLADLAKLPPLTREDIQNSFSELWSRSFQEHTLRQSATGGTTNTPVRFYRDLEALRQKTAIQLRFNEWAGFRPGEKVFYLWGAQSDYAQNPSWRWRLYDNVLMRRAWAQTSLLRPESLEAHRRQLNRLKPKVIYAYPTPLGLFCEYLRDCGREYSRPETVTCTAESLSDEQRRLIRETLGCEPFEQYGSRECGMIAAECTAHCGLHLNPAAAYVELTPMEGAEEHGLHELLITDLCNYGMPLIRYRSNDCAILAEPGECSCGIGYPRLKRVIGRTSEVFVLRDGTRVPGVSLTNRVIQVCPGLRKIQVVQETLDEFRLRYVAGPGFGRSDLERLRTDLGNFFPTASHWRFEAVPEIERERSGKTRFCISRVEAPAMVNRASNHTAENEAARTI